MDPIAPGYARATARFPRPRGDGPDLYAFAQALVAVSPSARGWTRSQSGVPACLDGFPVRTGMDPRINILRSVTPWFPRPHGDGPPFAEKLNTVCRVSPSARGWTLGDLCPLIPPAGFPVRTGMDPSEMHLGTDAWRYPRPHGDGPGRSIACTAARAVSPSARGLTLGQRIIMRHLDGFPVRTGMDPSAKWRKYPGNWFPRPHGDGPDPRQLSIFGGEVSPSARGCSRQTAAAAPRLRRTVRKLLGMLSG